jgi:hypothetical protein
MIETLSSGWESEAAWGKSTASQYELPDLTSKMDLPCEGCDLEAVCEADGNECSAFRNWCLRGKYEDEKIGKLLRVGKTL